MEVRANGTLDRGQTPKTISKTGSAQGVVTSTSAGARSVTRSGALSGDQVVGKATEWVSEVTAPAGGHHRGRGTRSLLYQGQVNGACAGPNGTCRQCRSSVRATLGLVSLETRASFRTTRRQTPRSAWSVTTAVGAEFRCPFWAWQATRGYDPRERGGAHQNRYHFVSALLKSRRP